MLKDDLYVKIAPTTYFRAPPCYRWKLVEGALPKCDLCPVKVQCKNDIESIKLLEIPKTYGDLKPLAEELLLHGNDTIGDCIISQRTGIDEKNYKPFEPDHNSHIL